MEEKPQQITETKENEPEQASLKSDVQSLKADLHEIRSHTSLLPTILQSLNDTIATLRKNRGVDQDD
ncbi:hypothetical protein [Paenibacillus cremeus]|uniref:Uncharacterized protein n=1 Tax=Paenibacillus cremeus TaxID=2163881 RepID=A0A559K466_9BACL|nr:hypothetical protein [Paenibacillus cremeus]TVY06911.1 hypothetical protein FPZ49_26720 [Paenibacillus cremeus]